MPTPSAFRTLLHHSTHPLRITSASVHAPRSALTASRFLLPQRRLAHGDYGSGDGNPAGEKPQDQGPNPSEHLEHPGPPPPDVGKGTGGANTKPSSSSKSDSNSGSSGGGGKEASGKSSDGAESESKSDSSSSSSSSTTQSSSSSSSSSKGTQGSGYDHSDTAGKAAVKSGAQPKFNLEPPKDVDQEDVKRHNDEVDQRKAKAHDYGGDVGDEVGKGFWSGEFECVFGLVCLVCFVGANVGGVQEGRVCVWIRSVLMVFFSFILGGGTANKKV